MSSLSRLATLLRKDDPTVTDVHTDTVIGRCPTCGGKTLRRLCPKCGLQQVPLAKAIAAKRYTFSPVYIPNRLDAHDEWSGPDELQEAMWGMVKATATDPEARLLTLQHLPGVNIGEWVELACWPYAHEVSLTVPGQPVRKASMPEGTPYMGVIWEPAAWHEVMAGRLRGLSMEGTSPRAYADIPTLVA